MDICYRLEDRQDSEGGAQLIAGATAIHKEITRVLAKRGEAIISDSGRVFSYTGLTLETDSCERLGRTLLSLLGAAVESRLAGASAQLSAMHRLVADRGLSIERLFAFAHLMERTVLDEIALDAAIGATSQPWPVVGQIIRGASFDLMAAYCDRTQQDSGAPPISDKLTTLYSRAMMDVVLSTEVQRAERFSFPIGFALFDVDKLSEVNQRYGYGVGDRLLERLGILIRKFFRQHDWVFRHGGDSIAVLLSQVAAEDALSLSSRVVAMVEQRLGFRDPDTDERVTVTVSGALVTGLGSLGEPFDAERLLLEADSTMKRAKTLGRNRVETSVLSPSLLSVEDAARYLKCEPAIVQTLIAEGKLQAVGTGATATIATLAVEDYRNAGVPDIKKQG